MFLKALCELFAGEKIPVQHFGGENPLVASSRGTTHALMPMRWAQEE